MTCNHAPGDPRCTAGPQRKQNAEAEVRAWEAMEQKTPRPNSDDYSINRAERVGPHLVLEVDYPSCANCAYEGRKVMVFLDVSETMVIRWKKIDPHFRDPNLKDIGFSAPSPAARFPASEQGWEDAITYARSKHER